MAYPLRERAEMKYRLLDYMRERRKACGEYPGRREIYEAGHMPALNMHYDGSVKEASNHVSRALPFSIWEKRLRDLKDYVEDHPSASYKEIQKSRFRTTLNVFYDNDIDALRADTKVPKLCRGLSEEELTWIKKSLIDYITEHPGASEKEIRQKRHGRALRYIGGICAARKEAGIPLRPSLWSQRLEELNACVHEADEMTSSPSLLELLYLLEDAEPGDHISTKGYEKEVEKLRSAFGHVNRRRFPVLREYFGISYEGGYIVLREPKTLEAVGRKYGFTREWIRVKKDRLVEKAKKGYYEAVLTQAPGRRNVRIDRINFSKRSRRTLRKMGIRTMKQLADRLKKDRDSFVGRKQFGRTSLCEVERKVEAFGY